VRAKIFHPSKKAANAPLKLLWSDERGWYYPSKEELFRQQCTVTNKLRKSENLMVGGRDATIYHTVSTATMTPYLLPLVPEFCSLPPCP
jgi:hypothetical protein